MTDVNPQPGAVNPYSGEPLSPTQSEGVATPSEPPVTAPVEPSEPPAVNPDVVSQSPADGAESPESEDVGPPSVEDRLKALELRLFGWHH